MEIVSTKSPRELLHFMEDKTFSNLPDELWDENLFLYNMLLRLMSLSVEDELFNQLLLYKIVNGQEITSIALLDVNAKALYFIGVDSIELNELLLFMENSHLVINTINLIDEKIANSLMVEPGFQLSYGDKKLYQKNKSNKILDKSNSIKEITKENAALYWDFIVGALEEGYRYFGLFVDGQLKSRAGLVRISKNRSEIIAVHTISEQDRKKGYASFLCNYLCNVALKDTKIVTWTCTHNNWASFKTAQAIGMNHYLSIYSFKYEG